MGITKRARTRLPRGASSVRIGPLCVAASVLLVCGCASWQQSLDLVQARRAQARGDCAQVERSLREAEQTRTLSAEAEAEVAWLRGLCLEQADRLSEARDHFRFVTERHPDSRSAARARERLDGLGFLGDPRTPTPAQNGRTRRNRAAQDLGRPNPVGLYLTDFGPVEPLRLCILREPGVSEAQAQRVVEAIRQAFEPYGLAVQVPRTQLWRPPADAPGARIGALRDLSLDAPCDRLLALSALGTREFLARTLGVFSPASGLLGEVESETLSRGYVFVRPVSAFHLFGFDAAELALHEAHHLLRCDHDVIMDDCYRQIARLKRAARANRASGRDFFPSITLVGEPLSTRAAVAARLRRTAQSGAFERSGER